MAPQSLRKLLVSALQCCEGAVKRYYTSVRRAGLTRAVALALQRQRMPQVGCSCNSWVQLPWANLGGREGGREVGTGCADGIPRGGPAWGGGGTWICLLGCIHTPSPQAMQYQFGLCSVLGPVSTVKRAKIWVAHRVEPTMGQGDKRAALDIAQGPWLACPSAV